MISAIIDGIQEKKLTLTNTIYQIDKKYVDKCLAEGCVSLFQKTYVICEDIALKALKRYIK